MFLSNVNNSNSLSFQAINLNKIEYEKSKNLVLKICNANSTKIEEQSAKRYLLNLLEPHIKKESIQKAGKIYLYEEILSDIYLKIAEFFNKAKKNFSIDALIKEINEYKPSNQCIRPEYSKLKSLDQKVSSYSDISLAEIITVKDLPVPQSAVVKEKNAQQLNNLIENVKVSSTVKNRLLQRSKGLKYREIAELDNVQIGSVMHSVQKGVMRMKYQNDGTLLRNDMEGVKRLAQTFDIDEKQFIKAVIANPIIIKHNPETLLKNAEETINLLKIPKEDFIKVAMKQTQILTQKSETLFNNVRNSAKLLEISEKEFIKIALNYPALFLYKPETILQNIRNSAKILNLPEKKFISMALYKPQILCYKPEILLKKIQSSSKIFNIDEKIFHKCIQQQPQLLGLSPKTLFNNCKKTAKFLQIPEKDFVEIAIRKPTLFFRKTETLIKNIKEASNLLGVPTKDFTEAAFKQPQIFTQKPETIKQNVHKMAQIFDMSEKDFTKIAMDRPVLFFQKPETLEKKSNIIKYYKKIQGKKVTPTISLAMDDKLYKDIIRFLLKNDKNIKNIEPVTKFNLETFIKENAGKTYNFTIPNDIVVPRLIEYATNVSEQTVGRKIFKFKVVD